MSGDVRNKFDLSSRVADILSTYTPRLSPPKVPNASVSLFTKRSHNPSDDDTALKGLSLSQTSTLMASDIQLLSSTKSPQSHYTHPSTSQIATIVPELLDAYDYHKHATKATELATSTSESTTSSHVVSNLRDLHTNANPLQKFEHIPESMLDIVAPSTATPSLSLGSALRSLPRTSAREHPSAVPLSAVVSHHAELSDSVGRRLTADAVTESHLRYQTEALSERLAAVRAELEAQRDDARLDAVRQRTRAEAAEQSLYELEAEVGRLQVRYENDVVVTKMDGAVASAQEELMRELRLRLQRAMAEADGARANARRLQNLYEEEVEAHAKTRREASHIWQHRELELLSAANSAESKASAIEEARLALDSQLRASEARAARAEQDREDAERALAQMADERERERKHMHMRLKQREKELLETHEDADTVRRGAYDHGHRDGVSQGLLEGRREGRAEGEKVGEAAGYEKGLREGREEGFKIGYEEGERLGLSRGRREARSEHDDAVERVSMERDELARDVRVLRDVIVQLREEQAELSQNNQDVETEIRNLDVKLREQHELRRADVETVNRLQQFIENLHGNITRLQRERDEAIQALREFRTFPDINSLKPISQAIHAPIIGGAHVSAPALPLPAPPSTMNSADPSPSSAALCTGSNRDMSALQSIIPNPSASPKSAAGTLKFSTKAASLSSKATVHPLAGHTHSLGPRLDAIRHVFDLSHLHRMHSELNVEESDPTNSLDGKHTTTPPPPTVLIAANTSKNLPRDDDIYLRARDRSTTCMVVLNDIASALFNAVQLASTVGEPLLAKDEGEFSLSIGGGAEGGGDKDRGASHENVLPSVRAMWRSIMHSLDADSVLLSHAAHTRARAVERLDALLRASRVEGRARIIERYFGEEPVLLPGDRGKSDEKDKRNIQNNAFSTASILTSSMYSSKSPSPDNILACIRKVPSRSRPSSRHENRHFTDTSFHSENSSGVANEGDGNRERLSTTSLTINTATGRPSVGSMGTHQHIEKPHTKLALSTTIGEELHTLLQYEEAYLPLLKTKVETTVAQVYAAIRGDVDEFQHSRHMAPLQSAKVKKMPNVLHSVAHTHRNVSLTRTSDTSLRTCGSNSYHPGSADTTAHMTASCGTITSDNDPDTASTTTTATLTPECGPPVFQGHHERAVGAGASNGSAPTANTASIAVLVPFPSHPRSMALHPTSAAGHPLVTASCASPTSSILASSRPSTALAHRPTQDAIHVKDDRARRNREIPNAGTATAAVHASSIPATDNSCKANKGKISGSSMSFLRPTASSVARGTSSQPSTLSVTSSPSPSMANSKSPNALLSTTLTPTKSVKLRIKSNATTVASQLTSGENCSPPTPSQAIHTSTTTLPTKGTADAKQVANNRLNRKHSSTQADSSPSMSESLEAYSQHLRAKLPSDPLLKLGQQFLYSADRTADAVIAQGCMSNVPYDSATATGRPDLPMHCAEVAAHVHAERQFDREEQNFVRRARYAAGVSGEDVELPADSLDVGKTMCTGISMATATDARHADAFVIPSDKEADRIHRYWTSQAPLGQDGVPMATHTREREDYRAIMGLDRRDTGTDL